MKSEQVEVALPEIVRAAIMRVTEDANLATRDDTFDIRALLVGILVTLATAQPPVIVMGGPDGDEASAHRGGLN